MSPEFTLPNLQRDLRAVEQQIQEVTKQLDRLQGTARFDQEDMLQRRLQQYEAQRDRIQASIQQVSDAA